MDAMLSRKVAIARAQMASEGIGWLVKEAFNQLMFYTTVKYRLKNCGSWTTIEGPVILHNPGNIEVGKNTRICAYGRLEVEPDNPGEKPSGSIRVGSNVYIGRFCGIKATRSVVIENSALIADRVFISDHNHEYADIDRPIGEQWITKGIPIRIGEGSWIGTGVSILPGVEVGKNAVVAAGAIVAENVDDFTVVGGNPAKVLKKYDKNKSMWISV